MASVARWGRSVREALRWSVLPAVATATAGVLVPVGAASAAEPVPVSIATDRQEQVLEVRDGVIVSNVSYLLPLPAGAPAHPAGCDRTGYLRYRPVGGPAAAKDADHVIVQQPGAIGGAVNNDSVAANTVVAAKASGQNVEFWALARRSSCLDETVGFDYALRTGNYLDAVDYYFNRKPIDGQVFGGFKESPEPAVLDGMGMERIIRDEYEMMLAEIPDQAVRQQKYVCTGISLGGLVTGFFADWDCDGNPATTGDAGYNQCAAFAAQDTMITSDPVAIQNTPFLRPPISGMRQGDSAPAHRTRTGRPTFPLGCSSTSTSARATAARAAAT